MTRLQNARARLANILWPNGIMIDAQLGFRLKIHETKPNAPLSPIYVNMRAEPGGKLTQEQLREIGACLFELSQIHHIPFAGIAGIPEAGEPLADGFVIAYEAMCGEKIPRIRLHKEDDGERRRVAKIKMIDDPLKDGDRILLLDDVASNAETKLEAVKTIRSGGFSCHDVLIGIDREQGASAQMNSAGCCLHPVWQLRSLLLCYRKRGDINADEYNTVIRRLATR